MENVTAAQVKDALERVIASFQTVLYEDDEQFLENMKTKNLEGDDIRRYQHWEWTQGVGLYGFWRLFEATKKPEYLDILKRFYEKQMEVGLPGKNINTVTPLLAMSYFAEYTKMMSIWQSVTSGLRVLCTIFCAQRKAVFSTRHLIP